MEARYRRVGDLVTLTVLLRTRVTGLSIDQVAERFEVSRRTAERMLAALRDCFPELTSEVRAGRKYWRLPSGSQAGALRLPGELDDASRRVAELERESCVQHRAQEQWRALADDVLGTSPVGIIVLDEDLRVVWANRALETHLGLRREDAIGRDMRELVQERIRHAVENPERFASRVLASYDADTPPEPFECHVVAGADRGERWLEHRSQPITTGPYAGGRIEHYIDVSESRRRLLEIPRDLSAAVLRPLRAPMAVLHERAEDALDSDADARAALREICEMARRMGRTAEISVRLAQNETSQVRVSVPSLLERVEREIRDVASRGGVTIRRSSEAEAVLVRADPALVVAALVELALNGIDAMRGGGDLELCARAGRDGWLRLEVRDSGPGVEAPIRERMFERFFTTRPNRAGLGLADVQEIARRAGGSIRVGRSAVGGAQIAIDLPAVPSGPPGAANA